MITDCCSQFGFDAKKIKKRLAFLYLSKQDYALGERLNREVIAPYLDKIVDSFYEIMLFHADSRKFLLTGNTIEGLKITQIQYLLTLGQDFASPAYFEGRLRIGVIHAKINLPLSVYQCAYSNLIQNIIDVFPSSITGNRKDYSAMLKFLIKITSLDMSLAIETYHSSHITNLEESVKEFHSREDQLRTKAETDALTGLYNRDTAFNHLAKIMDNTQPSTDMLYVLMVDLDHFKKVNDIYGHQAGDLVLQHAAKCIMQAVRSHDIVGRYGGEEFIVVLSKIDAATANIVAQRILTRIAETPIETNNQEIKITTSIGLTCLSPGDNIQNLVQRADIALYAAKNAGRNRIVVG